MPGNLSAACNSGGCCGTCRGVPSVGSFRTFSEPSAAPSTLPSVLRCRSPGLCEKLIWHYVVHIAYYVAEPLNRTVADGAEEQRLCMLRALNPSSILEHCSSPYGCLFTLEEVVRHLHHRHPTHLSACSLSFGRPLDEPLSQRSSNNEEKMQSHRAKGHTCFAAFHTNE